jgi:hypothetical protein
VTGTASIEELRQRFLEHLADQHAFDEEYGA